MKRRLDLRLNQTSKNMKKKLIARTLIKRGRKIVSHIEEYSDGTFWTKYGTPSEPIALAWECKTYDNAMEMATKYLGSQEPTVKRIEF